MPSHIISILYVLHAIRTGTTNRLTSLSK